MMKLHRLEQIHSTSHINRDILFSGALQGLLLCCTIFRSNKREQKTSTSRMGIKGQHKASMESTSRKSLHTQEGCQNQVIPRAVHMNAQDGAVTVPFADTPKSTLLCCIQCLVGAHAHA